MTTTASRTSLSPTIRCLASCTTTTEMARSPKSAFPQGLPTMRTAKRLQGWGADFSDYDNDGRPDIVVTDLSNKRYHLFSQQRRRQLPGCDQPVRHGRRDFPFFRLEHAFVRLRQ